MRALSSILLLVFTGLVSASGDSCVHVTASGMGYNKDQAVQNALRSAVEQTAGIYLSSQTSTQNFMLVSDKIFSNTSGYVSSFSVIASSVRDNFGLTELSVDACVAKGVLRDTLAAAKLIYELKDKPLIMVMVDDYGDNALLPQRITSTAFEKYFLDHGFRVVDEKRMIEIRERDKMLSHDPAEAAALGLRYGADIIVTGGGRADFARETEMYGRKYQMYNCITEARFIRTDVGDVLVSENIQVKKGADNKPGALQLALQTAAGEISGKSGAKLLDFWKSEAYNPQSVQLVAQNISEHGAADLEEKLLKINSVRGVNLQYFEGKTAVFETEIAGGANLLRNAIRGMISAEVIGVSANRLVLRFGAKTSGNEFLPVPAPETKPGLEIERLTESGIFASRIQFYAVNPFGILRLKNTGTEAISKISVSVKVPDFASLESRQTIEEIRSGESFDAPISVTLQEAKVLRLSQTTTTQARITVSAVVRGKTIKREIIRPVKIYGKNAFDWKDEEAIGAFLTPKAPVVAEFAHSAINSLAIDPEETQEKSFLFAVAVFDALSTYGIRYVKDPVSSLGGRSIDHVQYPVETLKLKTGDCDDASVLFASLLESAGIETALLLYSDHVLVMFNTGMPARNSDGISLDSTRYILHKNSVWIPLETTLLEKNTFQQAWKQAASDFRDALNSGEGVRIIGCRKAMDAYSPLNVGAGIQISTADAMKDLSSKVRRDMDALTTENRARLDSLKTASRDAAAQNRLGGLLAKAGRLTEALDLLTRVQKLNPADARIGNNLANVLCLMGKDSSALKGYVEAVRRDSTNGAIRINQGLCALVSGDEEKAAELIRKGVALAGGIEKASVALGIDMKEITSADKGADKTTKKVVISRKKIKALMRQSLDKVPGKAKSFPVNTLPVGSDPTQVRKVADLLIWL